MIEIFATSFVNLSVLLGISELIHRVVKLSECHALAHNRPVSCVTDGRRDAPPSVLDGVLTCSKPSRDRFGQRQRLDKLQSEYSAYGAA
jgi:hypothetical protein